MQKTALKKSIKNTNTPNFFPMTRIALVVPAFPLP